MQKNSEFRLIYTFNQCAQYNMAVDKALSKCFKPNDMPILRFYTWEKSFTVGLSQDPKSYAQQYQEFNNNFAKRMTGGGTLFHGHDISYSVVLPTAKYKDLNVKQTYEKICSFLLLFYTKLGLEVNYAKDIKSITLSKSDFCQVGFEAYDIIANGLKIGGNAQKRSKHVIFQHGSIPLYSVNQQKELGNSLEDLNIHLSYDEAFKRLTDAFKETFSLTLHPSSLTKEEETYVKQLLEENN